MLSLIVALPDPGEAAATPGARAWRYALSRDASNTITTTGADDERADTPLADHGSAALALLPRADELVAVVPASMLSWHRVSLPRMPAARVRAALDGLLEERLLDEPAALHLALQPGGASGAEAWVAACDKAWLQSALQSFEAAGRPVSRVVPQFTPLDAGEQAHLYACGSTDQAWLVRRAADGVQRVPLNAHTRAALHLNQDDGSLKTARCNAEPAVAALAEQLLDSKVRVRPGAQALVDAARCGWDLAQFDLASTGRTRLARRAAMAWAQVSSAPAWRPARWGAAALVVVQLLGLNAWAWRERGELAAKRVQVNTLLTKTFPKIPLVVDAPVQMERELAVLRQATGALSARDLEPMLAAMAQAAPAARPNGLEYAPGELTAKGMPASADQLSTWQNSLALQGFGSQRNGDALTLKPNPAGTGSAGAAR